VRDFPKKQWRIGLCNATGDQPVSREVGMSSGVTVSMKAVIGMDNRADKTPMRNLMSAVRYLRARYGDVQYKRFDLRNLH
jgi:hypothetical protein